MVEKERQKLKTYRFRAKLPKYFRIAAVGAIGVAILAVIAGFYRARSTSPFRLKSEHAHLSTDVVAEVRGYERRETSDGIPKYYIKADYAKTFSDNHQELTNVYIETYRTDGVSTDTMSAESALYVPEPDKNFTAYLKDNVEINTHDGLKVNTDDLIYTKKNETAEADTAVQFGRDMVRGKSFGATVDLEAKRIDLLKDVEIEVFDSPELARSAVHYAKVNSNTATYDQIASKIEFKGDVRFDIAGQGQGKTVKASAQQASTKFAPGSGNAPLLKSFELSGSVRISLNSDGSPTNIEAGNALYIKDQDRYELKDSVKILADANNAPTEISAGEVVFERSAGKMALSGNSVITQNGSRINADSIYGTLFANNTIRDAVARGNATLKQSTSERTTSISAPELNVSYSDPEVIRDANAVGESSVAIIPVQSRSYSSVLLGAARGIGVVFNANGLVNTLKTDGRTTIRLNSPAGLPDAANKRISADNITMIFNDNGQDIRRAEAVGNAELLIEPVNATQQNYRTTINAPRFDCEFFATGNNAKVCTAGTNARLVRVPMVRSGGQSDQELLSTQMAANFSQNSNDVETLAADGNAKFSESDRHAIADKIIYSQSDATVRLRGGVPTVWDSRGRAKANEIDWDTRNGRSSLRGSVSTTYYSQKKINDASPFASAGKPIFLTANSAEFDQNAETAVYIGKARGWQDHNYVRGDKISIDQAKGLFVAEGNVESVLYNAKLTKRGGGSIVATSAAAGSLSYIRNERILRYRNNVDIRQGTDRITAGVADVYLDANNEVAKTVTENNVVITQPGRRATGDWAQYTAEDQVATIRGNPASVSDAENGSSQSGQLSFNMRENRLIVDGGTKENRSGRSRTVYKIKN